jgi:tRNA(Ile)-lysidine synthase
MGRHKTAHPILKTFIESLTAFPVKPTDTLVVAVSGGPDSVCLLHLLRQGVSPSRLHVAHLNHGFRPEADEEAVFVSHLCQSWGIPCTAEKRPVEKICKENRLSKQEGARVVRYAFLKEVAKAQKAQWIALGHTADDQVETFLMHLLRGAGGEGLSGIPSLREGMIIRPMLSITREAILTELQEKKIPFREDQSNQDRRFLRSRIRHELIPMLTTYNPNIKETVLREALLLKEENHFLDQYLTSRLPEWTSRLTSHEVAFSLPLFCSLHKALQRRLIRWGIRHLHGNLNGIGFDPIETLLTRVGGDQDIQLLSLPHGIFVKKNKSDLLLTKRSHARANAPPAFELPENVLQNLSPNGMTIDIPQWKIRLALSLNDTREGDPLLRKEDCLAFFDFDTMVLPLTVRGWWAGDRFIPLGMKGRHKKLQDFFVDRKVPKAERDQVPLLICPQGIIWVIGYQVDERFKVTEATKRVLSLQVEGMA